MIGAICTLLSRGALISMACVIFILPAMFIIFDKVICKTSIDFLGEKAKAKAATKSIKQSIQSSGEQFPGIFLPSDAGLSRFLTRKFMKNDENSAVCNENVIIISQL